MLRSKLSVDESRADSEIKVGNHKIYDGIRLEYVYKIGGEMDNKKCGAQNRSKYLIQIV